MKVSLIYKNKKFQKQSRQQQKLKQTGALNRGPHRCRWSLDSAASVKGNSVGCDLRIFDLLLCAIVGVSISVKIHRLAHF